MRIHRILTAALAAFLHLHVPLLAHAQQGPLPLTPEQIEQAKKEAAQVSGTLSTQSLKTDAQGRPVLDARGSAETQPTSADSMRESVKAFQDMTGINGLETRAAPGNSGRAGIVTVNVNAAFDFRCVNRPIVSSAGSLAFRINSCDLNSGATMQLCDKPARGGTCSTDADFQRPFVLAPGVFSQLGEMQLGLGCNTSGSCRVTVKGDYTFGGNDEQLKQQAQVASTQADGSSVTGMLRQAVTEGDYTGKMREIGVPLKECADANNNAMANGTATTCDRRQSVTIATPQNQAQCEGARQCLKEAVSVQNFTRSCTRTFSLTGRLTNFNYPSYRTCEVADITTTTRITTTPAPTKEKPNPVPVVTTETVTSKTDTCLSGSTDARVGLTRVGETPKIPSSETNDTESVNPDTKATVRTSVTVNRTSWSEFYVDTRAAATQILSQTASPSPVTGACDTNPLSETRTSVCQSGNWFGRTLSANECSAELIDEGSNGGTGILVELDYSRRYGCGFCLTPQVGETCYGAPSESDMADSCATTDLEGCTLTGAVPASFTGGSSGLVATQRENYSCRKENRTCVQWSQGGDSCMSTNMTMGLENVRSGPAAADGSLNSALVAAAILDSTARGIEGTQDPVVPKIFNGEDMRCKRPTGGIGQILSKNCCRISLERPVKGNIVQSGCSLDEAKLAAARRAHYAHYVGEYCSRRLFFPRTCLQRTETYCVFPGILPRLVHEQGREQLKQIAGSSMGTSNIERAPLSFRFYDAGPGSWSPETLVNGVRVRAWQWPSYCANPGLASEKLLTDPNAKECPGVVSTWMATCDNAGGCGELPSEPEDGSPSWELRVVDPLQNVTSAVSRYAVVTGACTPATQQCSYTVSAWPAGVGGKAVVSRDLSWPLYSNEEPGSANPSAASYQMNNIADLMFRGYSVPGLANNNLPGAVRLDFSRDGGQTWTTHQLPTNLRNQEFTLPNSDVRVTGFCDASTNICGYRVTGTTTITTKEWGSPTNPDCSGFTAGQLSALDFGKMDLSEWLDSVLDKVRSQTPTELAGQATRQFQEFNSIFAGNSAPSMSASAPQAANFARAVPSEGFGPFNTTLVVSGYWPETPEVIKPDAERVTRVEVDWGDCTPKEQLSAVPSNEGTGFRATHRYESPGEYWACLGLPENTNITHNVKVTAYTSKGNTHNRVVKVESAWARFPGRHNNNDFVGDRVTAPVPNSGAPLPPKP